MLSSARVRGAAALRRSPAAVPARSFAVAARRLQSTELSSEAATAVEEASQAGVTVSQAPNRLGIWSRSQQPRSEAMAGPRFEQTTLELQPTPLAAIELIHQQPVKWVHDRVAVCDGGGGPAGHPRIFINLDKPQICECTYCGTPFANEHHKEHIQALPETPYPLE